MSATTVTGRGLGSADKKGKGDEHLRVGAEKIIGPRVVAVGSKLLDGSGDGSVVLPVLPGVTANYLVFATDQNAAAAAVSASLVITGSATTLTIKGTAARTISYCVLRVGLAV